jgi:Ca2+-binding RTX toxin-like protein
VDEIYGYGGNDSIYAGGGDDTVYGGEGNDYLVGGSGHDTLSGGNDNDTLFGGSGNDEVVGGSGDDVLDGGSGSNTLSGGSGHDTIYLGGSAADNVVNGGSGEDTVRFSNLGAITVNDQFAGALATELSYGISYSDNNDMTWAVAANGDYTFLGSTVLTDIEEVIFTSNNDHFSVTLSDTEITDADLKGGDDVVSLISTSDLSGQLEIFGGSGIDTFSLGNFNSGVTITASTSLASMRWSGGDGTGWITAYQFEAFTLTAFDDTIRITNDTGAQTINGHDGNDTIEAGGGNDTIDGGAGNDTINGGADNDTITGGIGRDLVSGGAGVDTFVFATRQDFGGGYSLVGSTTDAILDMQIGELINLAGVDANSTLSGNQAFTLAMAGFTGVAGQLRIENGAFLDGRTGQTVYGDTNGDRLSDFSFQVFGEQATAGLQASNFIF